MCPVRAVPRGSARSRLRTAGGPLQWSASFRVIPHGSPSRSGRPQPRHGSPAWYSVQLNIMSPVCVCSIPRNLAWRRTQQKGRRCGRRTSPRQCPPNGLPASQACHPARNRCPLPAAQDLVGQGARPWHQGFMSTAWAPHAGRVVSFGTCLLVSLGPHRHQGRLQPRRPIPRGLRRRVAPWLGEKGVQDRRC
jgi:hypothetical protein